MAQDPIDYMYEDASAEADGYAAFCGEVIDEIFAQHGEPNADERDIAEQYILNAIEAGRRMERYAVLERDHDPEGDLPELTAFGAVTGSHPAFPENDA